MFHLLMQNNMLQKIYTIADRGTDNENGNGKKNTWAWFGSVNFEKEN